MAIRARDVEHAPLHLLGRRRGRGGVEGEEPPRLELHQLGHGELTACLELSFGDGEALRLRLELLPFIHYDTLRLRL